MVASGTVQDVIVITVLRANDVRTKQVLAQALFNLLARVDTRREMIECDVDGFSTSYSSRRSYFEFIGDEYAQELVCVRRTRMLKNYWRCGLCECWCRNVYLRGRCSDKRKCAATLANLAAVPEILEKGFCDRQSNIVSGVRSMASLGTPRPSSTSRRYATTYQRLRRVGMSS